MPDKLNASVRNDGGVFILRAVFLILNVNAAGRIIRYRMASGARGCLALSIREVPDGQKPQAIFLSTCTAPILLDDEME